jgi:5-methyltetrahydrofolate--homocysteine methyltransferase
MSWLKSMMEKEPPEPESPIGTVVIGTLEPDMHETPKEMVRKALKRAGFKTVDLGKSVSSENFAAKAKETKADIIAVSVNTKPAKDNLPKLDKALSSAGLKGKVILMIGGASVTKEDADTIGALFGRNKEEAVAIAKNAIEKRK